MANKLNKAEINALGSRLQAMIRDKRELAQSESYNTFLAIFHSRKDGKLLKKAKLNFPNLSIAVEERKALEELGFQKDYSNVPLVPIIVDITLLNTQKLGLEAITPHMCEKHNLEV